MPSKKVKFMKNGNGNDVPIEAVPPYDKKKETIIDRFFRRREKTRLLMEKLSSDEIADLKLLRDLRHKDSGVKLALKGNMQVSDYACNRKVCLKTAYNIKLDDGAKEACRLMREHLIRGITDSAKDDEYTKAILKLLDKTFAPNSSGNLNYSRIHEVLDLNIKAKPWQQARALLLNSINSQRGRSYIEVSKRPSRQHKYRVIILDLADCWPEGVTIE